MQYKTYLKQQYPTVTEQVLYGRGINNIEEWLNANDFPDANNLINIQEGIQLLHQAIEEEWNVVISVDPDCDGYTSAAILMNFLYSIKPKWTEEHLTYIHHDDKSHGFNTIMDKIPDNTQLILSPDGGSMDFECHKKLYNQGIKIICLDHHECQIPKNYPYAIIINNNMELI